MSAKRSKQKSYHYRIVGLYLVLGIAWILFSDQLILWFVRDSEQLTQLQTYKGWGFVVITAGLLFLLIGRYYRRDMDQIDALRESESRFHTLFDNAAVAIWVHDSETGEILDANRRAISSFGYESLEQLRASDIWLKPPYSFEEVLVLIRKAANDGPQRFEWLSRDRYGRHFWEDVQLNRITLNGIDRVLAITTDITERKQAVEALRQSEAALKDAQCLARMGSWRWDPQVDSPVWSEEMYRIFGLDPASVAVPYAKVSGFFTAESWEILSAAVDCCVQDGIPYEVEAEVVRPDGSHRWVILRGAAIFDPEGRVEGLHGTVQDVTDHRQAEQKLRQAAAVYENSRDGIMITDLQGRLVAVNQAFTDITGYTEQEVLGRNPSILKSGRQDRTFYQQMWASISKHGGWSGEVWNRRKDGNIYPEWLSISTVRDSNGRIINYAGVFSDLTHLKHSEAELEYMATHDALTNLPNRRLLDARLEHAMDQAQRHNYGLAVLLLNLDRFKDINDSVGLTVGDALLQEMARRVDTCVRNEDTVARFGGDELLVVIEEIMEPQQAARVAEKILAALRAPYRVSGHEFFLTASIGISLYPGGGSSPEVLIRDAAAAVHRAKEQGRNRIEFYSEVLSRSAMERLSLEAGLRRALKQGELELHYQPQLYMTSGRLAGVEALVRWRHPEQGLILPDRFIPLAEQSELIEAVDEWVLGEACRQMAQWRRNGVPIPRVAVNLSAHELGRSDLVEVISALLNRYQLPAKVLELELTETAIMRNPKKAVETLEAMARRGIVLAVDDFGTGYSSLAYLQRLRMHRLKIDRAFVHDIPQNQNNLAICSAVIAMASSLGMETVAEGVEQEVQREFLAAASCKIGQGWLFARAMPAAELEAWIDHGTVRYNQQE